MLANEWLWRRGQKRCADKDGSRFFFYFRMLLTVGVPSDSGWCIGRPEHSISETKNMHKNIEPSIYYINKRKLKEVERSHHVRRESLEIPILI